LAVDDEDDFAYFVCEVGFDCSDQHGRLFHVDWYNYGSCCCVASLKWSVVCAVEPPNPPEAPGNYSDDAKRYEWQNVRH